MADAFPIDGQVVMLTAAKASVGPNRLPTLLARVQADLGPRLDEYARGYEEVHRTPSARYFLVEEGHWAAVGDRLDLEAREADAARRAHRNQLLRVGRGSDRRREFGTALEIREAVVVGTG